MAIKTAEPNRRDFMMISAGAFAAVGAAASLWPFVDQMNPDASALSLATIEVELSPVVEGQAITVQWRGKPVFIRHRTGDEIDKAKSVPVEQLPDPVARNENLPEDAPATDANRSASASASGKGESEGEGEKKVKEEWLVMVGICTHLGCIPKGQSLSDDRGPFGGWFCPCHGSAYDTAGRIRQGPAPRNLEVPKYDFLSETKIRIG